MTIAPRIEALSLNSETGQFFWSAPSKYHVEKTGMEAGTPRRNHNGKYYWIIKLDGQAYKRGYLVFFAIHGRFPTPCLDHINGNSLDDRPENLREATVTQNAWNHKRRRRKTLLPMGVRNIPASGRYQARIGFHGKQIHLGAFDTPEQAHAAYQDKRKELYGDYA